MNYLSFKEFVEKYGFKGEATSNVKNKEILDTLSAFGILKLNSTGRYMRDDKFTTTSGLVNLHPTKGTHWVIFSDKFYFDSYGCPPPTNILNHINNGIHSEYQIQKNDSYCAAYCLYVLYLTNTTGFKNAVLNLYYQAFKLNAKLRKKDFFSNKRKKLKVFQLNLKLFKIIRLRLQIIQLRWLRIQQSWLRI